MLYDIQGIKNKTTIVSNYDIWFSLYLYLRVSDLKKNFEDPMLSDRDIRKTKYQILKLLHFLLKRPVYAMANGNMLYTIYNVQYVICNLSV